jgi:chromosome segregation protein
MLSALELNGFKSFAERTRFEFPAGITVVVGPNGSGKSNVVDAIKWVLGAQSVKALRGKEMTDVIFSGSRTRRPAGAAEASLIFDNSAGAFDHDAAEIQITRRVYRSGESEYLINRQPCRLRDVRDLLADVGMSSGAYSIIEQGKVDAVLQASPKERRLIFEEAAGVSRFRIKREEAARRLERVEQNLLRLADIVGELDSRLQNVRSQAGKAQKYATAARRLEELRTRVALEDWRRLSTGIDRLRTEASAADGELAHAQRQLAECEACVAEVDASIEELQRSFRDLASAESTVRERAAQCQSTRSSHLARVDELKLEFQRLGEQLLLLATRAGDAQQLLAQTTADLDAAQRQCQQGGETLAQRQQALTDAEAKFASDDQAAAASQDKLDHAEAEAIQQLQQQQFLEAKRQGAEASLARLLEEAAPLKVACDRYAADRKQADASLSQHAAALSRATEELKAAQSRLAADRSQLAALHKRQAELEGRLTGARERQLMLEELERRLDGLTSGAKDVLHKARQDPGGPFRSVRGVVADLLHVDADSASLIEIALGERANHLVVSETRSPAPVLAQEASVWAGRTSFLRLDVLAPASAVDRVDLSAEPGVVGRADSFVEAGEELAPMVRRLLGRHWLVDTLATALRLANGPGRGLNFVTVAGEVVLADGTLTVGPRQSIAGLLSRRSELRALREQIAQIEQDASSTARECLGLEENVSRHEVAAGELASRQAAAATAHGESRLRLASLAEKLEQAEGRMASVEAAGEAARTETAELTATLEASRTRAAQLADEIAACRSAIAAAADKRAQGEARLAELRQALTEQRIEQARNEQRVEGLNRQFQQLQRDRAERHSLLEDTRTRAAECQAQKERLEASAAALAIEAAELTATKDQYSARFAELEQNRAALRTQRTTAAARGDGAATAAAKPGHDLAGGALDMERHPRGRGGRTLRAASSTDRDLGTWALVRRAGWLCLGGRPLAKLTHSIRAGDETGHIMEHSSCATHMLMPLCLHCCLPAVHRHRLKGRLRSSSSRRRR